jgi:hypothetical protein
LGQAVDKGKFQQKLRELSGIQLKETLSILASGKPVYTMHFDQAGRLVEVSGDGLGM